MVFNNSTSKLSYSQSTIISWLRFPLIIMVVYLHSTGDLTETDIPIIQLGIYEIIQTIWGRMIVHSTVPTYFFFSGFLMFYGIERYSTRCYKNKIRNRLKRLMVPYLIWNLIALIVWAYRGLNNGASAEDLLSSYYEKGVFSVFWFFYTIGNESLDVFGNVSHLTAPADLPFWYLRDLIIMSIISPFIYYFIKKMKRFSLLFFTLYFLSGLWPNIPGASAPAISFYGIGAYFSITKTDFSSFVRKYNLYILSTYICLLLFLFFTYHTKNTILLFPMLRFLGVFVFIGLAELIIRNNSVQIPFVLSESTFFIYAIHYIAFLSFVDKLLFAILPQSSTFNQLIHFILCPLLKICLYVTLYIILSFISPKLASIITAPPKKHYRYETTN